MKRRRWRWKRTRVIIEATIIGATVALLVILFAESRFDRQQDARLAVECVSAILIRRSRRGCAAALAGMLARAPQ
jgi:hypothetical protein